MATYNQRSLNQIVSEFKNIADNHRFIHSFACGTQDDFATSGDTKYPAMWIKHDSVVVNRNSQDISFSILIIDRVKKDRSNLQEILSDTIRTLSDVRIQIEQPSYGWSISFGQSTPVYEEYIEDEVAGWESTFTITQPFINDVCAIPFIVPPTPTTGWNAGGGNSANPYVPTSRILTINGVSYDLSADRTWTVSGGGAGTWGSITGTLSDQTDLQTALNAKQNTITTGTTTQYFRGDLSLATFPTAVSSFTNDAAYITASSASNLTNKTGNISQWTNDSGYITASSAAATYQPLDSDLTTIAGLTATTDNFIVSVANAWASRTPAQVKTTLGLDSIYHIIRFQHTSLNPADALTYYISTIVTNATTAANSSRRTRAIGSGTIPIVAHTWNLVAGSSETITVQLANITQSTTSTSSTFTWDVITGNVKLTFSSPLSYVDSDEIEVRVIAPTWATNPTTVIATYDLYFKPS